MAHVFVSYAHQDKTFAKALIGKLKKEGITHWLDNEHLRSGDDWRQAIDDAIRASFALVVVMSPTAKASEYVTYEWAFALGVGIRVIPLLYQQASLHPRLEALQNLNFTLNIRPWDKLIQELKLLESGYVTPVPPNPEPDTTMLKLIAELSSENNTTKRRKVIKAMEKIGDQNAVPALIDVLQSDKSASARQDAIIALVKLDARAAIRPLIAALHQDGGVYVRAAAAWALGEFKSQEAVDSLIEVLEELGYKELPVKRAAARALGKIGDKRIAPRLVNLLRSGDLEVSARIIETLGYLGEPIAVEPIAGYLSNATATYINETSRAVNQVAAEALERIGTPEAITIVEEWRKQAAETKPD